MVKYIHIPGKERPDGHNYHVRCCAHGKLLTQKDTLKKGMVTNMEMRIKELAERFVAEGKGLLPFRPFPPACERQAYEGLPETMRQHLIHMGEEYLGYAYPQILATDFMAFTRRGNRGDHESLYFARRHALNALTVAECVEHRGRFLDDIINGLYLICEESGWQLPAHNSGRYDPQEPLPDPDAPILDLFACETGAQLSCIYYLLGEELDAITPIITRRIRRELEQRIITPYLNRHYWWMGTETEPLCNWTPWCTANILLTLFLKISAGDSLEKDEKTAELVVKKAAESLDFFLKEYGEDGCCDEGAHYYRHAALCLNDALFVLNQVTSDAFSPVLQWSKVKNMGMYLVNVHIAGDSYFNFADSSPILSPPGVREYLYGKNTKQPALMQFAAKGTARAGQMGFLDDESYELDLFCRMQAVFHYEEIMHYYNDIVVREAPVPAQDIFYPSVGLLLAHSQDFALAVKAGDNNDSHNHNDTGSITLYKKGQPILIDIGVESYTKKTFSDSRYEIWTMQSGYHNLPTIEGIDQAPGEQYHASQVAVSLPDSASLPETGQCVARQEGDNTVSISMELATAYPLAAPACSYIRNVTFYKAENRIVLSDHTNSSDVTLNFITYEQPQAQGDRIQVGNATISFQGAELITVETLPVTDPWLQDAWKHDLYRLRLKMTEHTFQMDIY